MKESWKTSGHMAVMFKVTGSEVTGGSVFVEGAADT